MQRRYRLTRETFIARGLEQNAIERKLGIPAETQIDPEQAWTSLYGRRKYVYLTLENALVQYGGDGLIIDDEMNNGLYPSPGNLDG
jgi:hypothetical protein